MPVEIPIAPLIKPFLGVGRKFMIAALTPFVATAITIILHKTIGIPVEQAIEYARQLVLIPAGAFIAAETVLDYRNGRK